MNKTVNELRVCDWCGSMFIAVQYAQRFCTKVCGYSLYNSTKWVPKPRIATNCQRCGCDITHKKSHAIYCSKTCKSMDHTFNRRRGTRTKNKVRRQEIIARDGSRCYLCGKSLSTSEVELDHLIPVLMGGDTDPSNLATACRPCNRSRGASLTITQILKRNEIRSMACR